MEDQMANISSSLTTISNNISSLQEQSAVLSVSLNSIFARLDVLEKMISVPVQSKRSIRVSETDKAPVESLVEQQPITKSDTSTTTPNDKILNALTFFKKIIMYSNYKDMRSNYNDVIKVIKPTIKKQDDSEAMWVSIGNTIWKTLDKDQKKDITDEFKKWKLDNHLDFQNQLTQDEE